MYNYQNQTNYDTCNVAPGFKDNRPFRFYFVGDGNAVYCAFDAWITVVRIIVTLVAAVVTTTVAFSIVFHKRFILIGFSLVLMGIGFGSIALFIIDGYFSVRANAWCKNGLTGADLQQRSVNCDNGLYMATMGIDAAFVLIIILTCVFALCTSRKKFWMKQNDPHRREILDTQLEDIRQQHKQARDEEEEKKKTKKGYLWEEADE
jgi:uncharacterized membrane protein